jgi:hypothetical protein
MSSLDALVARIRRMDVGAASGLWQRAEGMNVGVSTYFARSDTGDWWSHSSERGVIVFDGKDWWSGSSIFDMQYLDINPGGGVHHDGLLQEMLSPGRLLVWGERPSEPRPMSIVSEDSGHAEVLFAGGRGAEKADFTIRFDLNLGYAEKITTPEQSYYFVSLEVADPPRWLFAVPGRHERR